MLQLAINIGTVTRWQSCQQTFQYVVANVFFDDMLFTDVFRGSSMKSHWHFPG